MVNKNDHHIEMITITIRVPYDPPALMLALESVDQLREKMIGQAAFEFGRPDHPHPEAASYWPENWKTSIADLKKTFSVIVSIIAAHLEKPLPVEFEDFMNEQF